MRELEVLHWIVKGHSNLQIARGTYQQVVGFLPPGDLVEPQPLSLPAKNEQDAIALAANNNPTVIAAMFNDAAAKDAVDEARAARRRVPTEDAR